MNKKNLVFVIMVLVFIVGFVFLQNDSKIVLAQSVSCSVSPSSQSASQGGSATYTVKNNSTEGVWAGVFAGGGNVTVNVAGAIPDPHPSQVRGKIYLQGGQSTTFNINAYAMDRADKFPANPGSYQGSVTCAKVDPYQTLPAGTYQSISFNFTVLDAGQRTCGLETISSPNNYGTVLQGGSGDFVFKYHGSDGGKMFYNINQNIEGVTFSLSPSGTLKAGDIVRLKASASYGAPIKSYYPASQFAPRPITYGCEIDGKKTNYDGFDFGVIEAGSTAFTGFDPEAPLQISVSPNISGLVVKKGDRHTFNVILNNPGNYSGKAALKLYDVPPGITADLKMDSDFISSRGNIKGVMTLNVTGRVPSGANRLILKFEPGDNYRQCKAGVDYLCYMKAIYNDSKVFTIYGEDSNFGSTNIPAMVNAIEPSILKRTKVMPGGIQQENSGFLLMNMQYGPTPFISADVRTSSEQFCYPAGSGNCYGGGKAEIWYVSRIDLKDPLKPDFAENKLWVMQSGEDIAGDDGGHHEPTAVGMSRDGTIAMGSHHQGLIKMSSTQEPSFSKMNVGTFERAAFFVLDSAADTFRVNASPYNGIFTKQSGYTIRTVSDRGYQYEEYVAAPLPRNIPQIEDRHAKIAPIRAIDGESSDGIVVLDNGGVASSSTKYSSIAVYSLDKSSALGRITLPGVDKYNNTDGNESSLSGFETPNGKYAFVAMKDKAILPVRANWEKNEQINFASNRTFYLYKLDEVGKKLVPIIEQARLSGGGEVKEVTPIHISGKDFLMVFTNKVVRTGETSTIGTPNIAIYSIDELSTGKVRDIASRSISSMKNIMNAESLIKGDETYVYTVDGQGAFLIWKFDKKSLSGTGSQTGTPYVSPGVGVTPYYPTQPIAVGDPNCPLGTVYQTSAGKLCVTTSGGVTTTTEYNFNTVPIQGCSVGDVYNSITGEKCNKNIEFMGPPIYNFGTITLRNGSTGEAVKELQRFLNARLNLGLVIDGKLGPKTIAVIKKWQSDNGLVSDGLVGAKTKALMNAVVQ